MKLWVDDIRLPPDETWVWARNLTDAQAIVTGCIIEEIAFDHDAGTGNDEDDFIHLASYIERLAASDQIQPMKWSVHSANPNGARDIEATMKSAERFWKKWGYANDSGVIYYENNDMND